MARDLFINLPKDLKKFVEVEKTHPVGIGGVQTILKFPNDYGASIVRFAGSYGFEKGLWEMAVIKYSGDDWEIKYDTPITDDVLGYLSEEDVITHLQEVQKLN